MYAPPPTTAARINGRRLNIATSCGQQPGRLLHVIRQAEAESDHELGRRRDEPGPADLRRDGDQYTNNILWGRPRCQRVTDLPDVGGRRRVERDQCGELDQGVGTRVEAAPGLPFRPDLQAGREE